MCALTAQAVTWQRLLEASSMDEEIALLEAGAPEDRQQWPEQLRMYHGARAHLTTQDPVVMYKGRAVVPRSLRVEVLGVQHDGQSSSGGVVAGHHWGY